MKDRAGGKNTHPHAHDTGVFMQVVSFKYCFTISCFNDRYTVPLLNTVYTHLMFQS